MRTCRKKEFYCHEPQTDKHRSGGATVHGHEGCCRVDYGALGGSYAASTPFPAQGTPASGAPLALSRRTLEKEAQVRFFEGESTPRRLPDPYGQNPDRICPECGTPSEEYDEARRTYMCEECGRRF